MGFRKVKISVDGSQCGKDCPFVRLDTTTGAVQCTLFVDVLDHEVEERRIIPATVCGTEPPPKKIKIFRAQACLEMEEL